MLWVTSFPTVAFHSLPGERPSRNGSVDPLKSVLWALAHLPKGFVGLLALTLVFVTSLGWVRRRLYEFFLVAHISLIALLLAAFILHWPAVSGWIYVCLSALVT